LSAGQRFQIGRSNCCITRGYEFFHKAESY
jgi:hypothetical protein